jgi:hypothetical protein
MYAMNLITNYPNAFRILSLQFWITGILIKELLKFVVGSDIRVIKSLIALKKKLKTPQTSFFLMKFASFYYTKKDKKINFFELF